MNINQIKQDIRNGNFEVEEIHDIGGANVIITDRENRKCDEDDLVVRLDDARAVNTLFRACINDFGNDYGPEFYRLFALSTIKHEGDLIKIIRDVEEFLDDASYESNQMKIVGEEVCSNHF